MGGEHEDSGRGGTHTLDSDVTARERPARAAEPEQVLEPGAHVGRYTLERLLGAGGVGQVYAARDPELDRVVAIKVLRPDVRGASLHAQARFLREAQALARLNHPNVVAVHDVGTVGDRVFVAMELVNGSPLSAWLAERRRGWREIRDAFLAAGRGLEAAHAAGIIHRDFKPQNVLVGERRVVVLDFGLARRADDGDEPAASGAPSAMAVSLTATGDIAGTPAYMSPEQFAGEPLGPASDQFSFCVALCEALYGARPFGGDSAAEIAVAIGRGEPRLPRVRGVPRFLAAALLRGLRRDPRARHPSMSALLSRLARDPARQARRAGVAFLAVGAAAAAVVWLPRGEPAPRCRAEAVAWTDATRASLRAAFAATGKPFAAGAAERVVATLDRHAAAWSRMRVDACEATLVRGEQSAALMDARMACLDRRRGELESLAQIFTHEVDGQVAGRAVDAAGRLTPVEVCADARALSALVPPPDDPEIRRGVEALEAQVARARALLDAGKVEAARTAMAAAGAAAAHPFAPLRARALLAQARIARAPGYGGPAARTLVDASIRAAVEGRDDALAAEAWVVALGERLEAGKPEEVLSLVIAAEAAIIRAGDPRARRAELERGRGIALVDLGRYAEAKPHLERAVAMYAGGDNPQETGAHVSLSNCLRLMGDYPGALRAGQAAVASAEKLYGPIHRNTAVAEMAVATAQMKLGENDRALASYRRVREILDEVLGPSSAAAVTAAFNVAVALIESERLEEARVELGAALARGEQVFPANHPMRPQMLGIIGAVDVKLGRRAEARDKLGRALAMYEAISPDQPQSYTARLQLGELELAEGRHRQALAQYRKGLEVLGKSVAADSPHLVEGLTAVGKTHVALGEPREGLPPLERAVAICAASEVAPVIRAEARFQLARGLRAARRDPARARQLAVEALAGFEKAGRTERAAEVRRWL